MELYLRTLPYDYYEKMHTSGSANFLSLYKIAERIERDFNERKTPQEVERRPYQPRRGREGANEVAFVSHGGPGQNFNTGPRPQTWGASRSYEPRRKFPPRQFTPLPRPLSQLLPKLLEERLVAKEMPRNPLPNYAGFNPNKSCEFHMGEKGHDVDDCIVLKNKVQNLIDGGMLDFKEPEPNVHQNPLPNHQGVNLILGADQEGDEESDDEYEAQLEQRRRGDRRFIERARANGEIIDVLGEGNGDYRFMVGYAPPPWALQPQQEIIPDGWGGMDDVEGPEDDIAVELAALELEVEEDRRSEEETDETYVERSAEELQELVLNFETGGEVATITPYVIHLQEEEVSRKQEIRPVVIKLADEVSGIALGKPEEVRPVVINLPPKVPINLSAVPWIYPSEEVGTITRSGRCYAPKEGDSQKRAATEEDAKQVLAVVRTSEFEVVEQLRKMPAQISLLELFKSSERHQNALIKVLNEVHVPETINEVQLEDFVGAILLKDQISFSDEDLPEDGRSHNKALYIAVKSSGREVSRVLIDNGSAFNLCPLSTLRRLGKEKIMRPSRASIRAFDGMRKEVIGEVELEVTIGPTMFLINFIVVDVPSAFNFLLGRPWIHMAGAVPSSLHQSVKFVVNGKLVTVHGESDFKVYLESAVPYVGGEDVEEASYHSLELVHVVHTPVGSMMRTPRLSASAIMTGKVLIEHGYVPGKGLGKNAQGIVEPITAYVPMKRGGVGYQGESADGESSLSLYGDRGWSQSARSGGRGRRGRRGGRVINPSVWKGKIKEVQYHEIPISRTFPGPPRILQEEEVFFEEEEEDLAVLYEDEGVNVIISGVGDTPVTE